MISFRITAIATLAAALCMTCSCLAGTITLRSAVRLAADAQQVRLADIADISGADAEAHADLVITQLTDPTRAVEIHLREVRARLDEAGAHWGRINLSGRSVIVRPRRSGATTPPLAMEPAAVSGAAAAAAEPAAVQDALASELMHRPTPRGMIAAYMVRSLGVQPDDLRLGFDERQADFLDAQPGEMRFEIEPSSNLHSSRVDLTVRVWIDGFIDRRTTVRVSPTLRMAVVIVNEEIRRDDPIDERSLRVEHQWLTPHQPGVVTNVSEAAGRHAAVRLRSGDTLRTNHLRRETLIRRGEQVIVRCLVGSAVISLQAEARADGSEGETIEFRKLGERETFLAVVTGRNEAVVNLSR